MGLILKKEIEMGFINDTKKFHALLAMLITSLSITSCAADSAFGSCPDDSRINQTFSFDMRENRDIKLLDYFYGIPECPAIRNSELMRSRGDSPQIESQMGFFRRAHELYVKWRVISSGKEYQEIIDLRNRLPRDMTNHEIHFSIQASQLYVYLIVPEPRPPDLLPKGPRATQHLKTLVIYPD